MVAIPDDERQRRPERPSLPEAREHLDLVALELLARAAAVALLPAPQVCVDRVLRQLEPGGKPRDDRDERRPVRFACGHEPERHPSILRSVRGGETLTTHRLRLRESVVRAELW